MDPSHVMKFPYSSLRRPRYCLTLVLIGFWALVSQVPYPVMVQLARLMAMLLPHVARRRCVIVEQNLAHCFPELSEIERQQLVKKNLFHTCLGALEAGMVWFWPRWRLEKRGELRLDPAVDTTSGALVVSFHNTTMDSVAAVFHSRLDIADLVYRPHKNPVFEYFQVRARERHNPISRCLDRIDVRGIIRSLRKGRWVWYLPDQDYGIKQGVFAKFFGLDAATVTGTVRFARAAKVPVVPLVHYRDENNRCIVEVKAPLENFPSGDEQYDVQRINDMIESEIRKRPEQYFWVHRRFKTRPEGAPHIYGKYSKGAKKAQ